MEVPLSAHPSPAPESQTVGIFLEEIAYFLEDMERDLWWLLRVAHQPRGPPAVVTGIEELEPLADENVEAIIAHLQARAEKHAEDHVSQVRAKITIIPTVVPEERAILNCLPTLKFHCKGKIEVFHCMKEANNSAIWKAYHTCVASKEPQWTLKTDGPGQQHLFSQCIVVVPVYADRQKQEIKLFNVWSPEKKKRHWAFPGGEIKRGVDQNLYDTARREWQEAVGFSFGLSWSDCFVTELPTDPSEPLKDPSVCQYVQLEKDGHRYPTRPYIFVRVTDEFYSTSRCYEDANGLIRFPRPEGDYVRLDDDVASARRVHTEGVRFLVHDEARWVSLEWQTGKMLCDDGRPQRRENAELFRQQPERVWQYLAEMAGLDPKERQSVLPADFPEDGPFAVRMSGIDKVAVDEDVQAYFEDSNIKVKKVEQFNIPRHTARIDFFDREALEQALQLSGRSLQRRKVKVELWADNPGDVGTAAAAPGARPLKPFEGPLPENPPFKVTIRGLDKSVTRDDLGYFFWDRDCQVKDVEFPLRNERHAGAVEFADVESLRRAMGLNRAVYKGREVAIDLYTTKDSSGGGGGNRSGGGGGGGGDRDRRKGGSKGGGKGGFDRDREGTGGFERSGGGRDRLEREPPSRSEFGSERPRLMLQPRTKPRPGEPGYSEFEETNAPSTRPDPFGGARFKATRADGDNNWRS